MEPNPETRPALEGSRIQIIVIRPGVLDCAASAGAENEVVAILAFVGNLTNYSANITFDLWGESQTLTSDELKTPENRDPIDYVTFLREKAHQLLCATNFKVNFHKIPAETEQGETVLI